MSSHSRTRVWIGALALGGIALAGIDGACAADPIKVGAAIEQVPPGRLWQTQQRQEGLQIALKLINDAKGALGRPFGLVVTNPQGPPDRSGEAVVEKLIDENKVVAIIAAHDSAAAVASLEAAHQHKVPLIADTPSQAFAAKLYPEGYNLGLSSRQIAVTVADAMRALGLKRVVAFAENTDTGIELANFIGQQLNARGPGTEYSLEMLDPGATDFSSVLQPYRTNPPDAIIQLLRAPAAYRLIEQLHEQGLGPSAKTRLYDGATLIDDPAFWHTMKAPVDGMLVLSTSHPKIALPEIGRKVAEAYRAKTNLEPGNAVFSAADELLVLAAAVESGGSSESEAIAKALATLNWTGTRGKIGFSAERGESKYHQWLDVPTVTFQITAARQAIGDTLVVQEPGKDFDAARVAKPK